MPNITEVIKQIRKEFGTSGYNINNGLCEDFTTRVIDQMGGYSNNLSDFAPDDMDCELPAHYCIEYNGKYYDAECSKGVDSWTKLPIFRKYFKKYPEELTRWITP